MTRTSIDGVNLYWEQSGQGDPLLLIMGLGWSCDLWYPIIPGLERHFTVLRYDARGIGRSDVPEGPYSVELMAADAVAVLDAAGIESAHVLGMSLGGIVAQEVALSYPDRARGLVLAATHPGGADLIPPPPEVMEMLVNRAQLPLEESIRAGIEHGYHPSTPAALIEEDVRRRLALPTAAAGYFGQLTGATGYGGALARAAQMRAPVLVLTGADDRLIPAQNSTQMAQAYPNAELVVLPDTGHVITTEAPERVVEIVTRFFTSAAVAS